MKTLVKNIFSVNFHLEIDIFPVSGESRRGGEDKMLDDLEKSVLKIYEEVNIIFAKSHMYMMIVTRSSARTRPTLAPSTC